MIWQQADCQKELHMGARSGGALLLGNARDIDLSAYAGTAQCVYIDPPFFTGDSFSLRMRVGDSGWAEGTRTLRLKAFSDARTGGRAPFLALLGDALRQAHALLQDSGALFLHLDSRMNAYARLLCDEIFGEGNFVNEIIWAYQTGGRAKAHFSRKHDVILFYAKSRALYFDITQVPISRKSNRANHMRRTVDATGRPCRTIRTGGKVYTYYDDAPAYPDDVWADVSHLQQKDPQRTGYETQKPQALLDRIIRCCTRPGDLVADLFCGSGTTLTAAADGGRRYLGVDCSPHALSVSRKRLLDTALVLQAPFGVSGALLDASVHTGIGYYEITLNAYTLPPDALAGAAASPPDLTLSGLDAIDQWSVGFLREGVFRAWASAARRKQSPVLTRTLELPLLRGTAAVSVVDVLGNRSVWVGSGAV